MSASHIPKISGKQTGFGHNLLTVGDGGNFPTVQAAVDYINTTDRYTVKYDTGTATLTKGSRSITPSGGASWASLSTTENAKELWLYLDSARIWMPLIGIAPHLTSTTWGNYGELKYPYEGATGAKSYRLVTPNWFNILLLPGEVIDDEGIIDWPLFTTLSGVDKEVSVFRGGIHVDASSPGIWMKEFKWGSIYGVSHVIEEALVTIDDTVQSAEAGYAELIMHRVSGGAGNADRDVTYRTSSMISHALFKSTECEYFAYYDVVQCTARNLIFKQNDVFISTQDTTVMEPTGLRWFSGSQAPETNLYLDVTSNNFYIVGAAGARQCKGLILLDDVVSYLTTPPDIYGRVFDNHIQAHQLGTGDATGIQMAPSLFSANSGRVLVDNNLFDVVSAGGTRHDIYTHGTASPFVLGRSNVTADASALAITGAPFRMQNQGTSTAIASGATIAHGLRATPTDIQVTPADAGVTDFYASADGTNITVTYSGGGTHAFHWKAGV